MKIHKNNLGIISMLIRAVWMMKKMKKSLNGLNSIQKKKKKASLDDQFLMKKMCVMLLMKREIDTKLIDHVLTKTMMNLMTYYIKKKLK